MNQKGLRAVSRKSIPMHFLLPEALLMRLSVASLRQAVKGNLTIQFVPQALTSYGGLELLQVVGRRVDISIQEKWGQRAPRTQIVTIGAAGSIDASLG
jgi:hypothetical protein